jgi:hypothetical protein
MSLMLNRERSKEAEYQLRPPELLTYFTATNNNNLCLSATIVCVGLFWQAASKVLKPCGLQSPLAIAF